MFFFCFFWFLWFFLVSLVFLVPVLCSSVPFQPSPNKRAQAPVDSIEFPMGSKETLARNWSFHFSQVNYISLFIFVVDKDLSKNSCLTHATTVLSVILIVALVIVVVPLVTIGNGGLVLNM